MENITRIALTGAPCSGKTSIINRLVDLYQSENRRVYICPEAATQVIASGVGRDNYLDFEANVAKQQIINENEILSKCEEDSSDVVIFYDRALTDCFSYVDDTKALESVVGVSVAESWSRYDAVIMLEVAGKDQYKMDDVRFESYDEALSYQKNLLSVMVGHPHLRFIKNAKSIDDKLLCVMREIDAVLSELEIEKKYLIEFPDFQALAKFHPFKTTISQTYLTSKIGSHRIRKRSANGVDTYFDTLKIRVSDFCAKEIENIISEKEYNELMLAADPEKNTINKDRYCFLYDGQYFELDVFSFWNDKALIELELSSAEQQVTLPSEIKVIADVSEDKKYKNNYLAGLKL